MVNQTNFEFEHFNLSLPVNYKVEDSHNGILTIVDAINGFGALNISSYQVLSSYKFVLAEELKDFLVSVDGYSEDIFVSVKKINTRRIVAEFVTLENRYWKVWLFFEKGQALFVSYNCAKSDNLLETIAIDKIVDGIYFK